VPRGLSLTEVSYFLSLFPVNPIDTLNSFGSGGLADAEALSDGPVGKIVMLGIGIVLTVALVGVIFTFVKFIKKA